MYKKAFQRTFAKSADFLNFQMNWNDFRGMYVGVGGLGQNLEKEAKFDLMSKERENDH